MAKKVRVGFIGTGGIADYQASFLKKMADVEILAGADVSKKALETFAGKHGVPHAFADYKEMLKLKALDAVSVCTPNYLHKAPVIAALRAGKDVMVEKPMAMNAREAQAMVDAAKQARRKLVVGFQFRFSPEAQALKTCVDDGQIGKPLYARVQALRRRGIPSWGVFGRKDLQGGGALIDIGVHMIELAHYLIGSPDAVAASAAAFTYLGNKPSDVLCAWGNWDHKTYTVEDLAVGFVRFANGAVMSVESSFVAYIEQDVFNVQIMGEKGGFTYSPPKVFRDEAGLMVNVELAYVGAWESMQRKIENWIAYVRGEADTEAPGEAGVAVQKILDGLYRSAEKGKEVSIR